MERTVIALHGWASTGKGSQTLQMAKEYFSTQMGVRFVAPTYDYTNPKKTANLLVKTVDRLGGEDPFIMGISFGGFWARWLANNVEGSTLFMLNPALDAYTSSAKYIGENENYVSGFTKLFVESRRKQLKKYEINVDKPGLPITSVVATDDDVLPPTLTEDLIGSSRCAIHYVKGGHRLTDPDEWLAHLERAFYTMAE